MKNRNGISRRRFVRNLAGTIAGVGAATQAPLGFPQIITNMGKPNSKFNGVQIGTITYSYRSMPDQSAEAILGYVLDSGVNAIELMGEPAEAFAGAPVNPVGREERALLRQARQGGLSEQELQQAAEIQAAQDVFGDQLANWRAAVSMDKFEQLRRMYADAGVSIYAWKPSVFSANNTDAEISYGFRVAKAFGASHCTVELPSDPAQSLRLGKLAEQNGVYIAYHTHQQGSMTAFDTAFDQSSFNRSNVDLGHFVAGDAGDNPVEFLHKYHDKIVSAHLKDRQTIANGAGNLLWGTGDTPLVEMLQLARNSGWTFPMTAELEYQIPEGSNAVAEVAKCVEFCRRALEG